MMHDADPHGYLVINSEPMTGATLAQLCQIRTRDCTKYLAELKAAGAYCVDGQGRMFSPKMLKDREKLEQDRENGKTGGNPNLLKGVNPPVKGRVKADAEAEQMQTQNQNRTDVYVSNAAKGCDVSKKAENKIETPLPVAAPVKLTFADDDFSRQFSEGRAAAKRERVKAALEAVAPERLWSELRGAAEMRGSGTKWAAHRFKELRGKFPELAWNNQPAVNPSGETLDWIEIGQAAYAKSRNDPDDGDIPF